MADIELVIKMAQESYNNLKIGCTQRVSNGEMIEALKNGTPLDEVLDKIRDEIEKASLGKWYVGRLDGKSEDVVLLDKALEIIDKYKEVKQCT